ncbi:hypothetical protein T484DRAFT_3050447 [Baffinella frigidus]|nr:hypothetical protein T484DRAFT_3050447 [Cryptophyta sp. CCMP2293]
MRPARLLAAAALLAALPWARCSRAKSSDRPEILGSDGGVSWPRETAAERTLGEDVAEDIASWVAEVTDGSRARGGGGKSKRSARAGGAAERGGAVFVQHGHGALDGEGDSVATRDKKGGLTGWLEEMLGVGLEEERCMASEVEPSLQLSVPGCAWGDDTTVEATFERGAREPCRRPTLPDAWQAAEQGRCWP